tara:strand:- start:210 stop:512 length:303 start_codon:yes stop_codon:yes gene_type:complete
VKASVPFFRRIPAAKIGSMSSLVCKTSRHWFRSLQTAPEFRAQCIKRTVSIEFPEYKRSDMCGCIASESQTKGLRDEGPNVNEDRFGSIVEPCIEMDVNQ